MTRKRLKCPIYQQQQRERAIKYYYDNIEEVKAKRRKRYWDNRDKILAENRRVIERVKNIQNAT